MVCAHERRQAAEDSQVEQELINPVGPGNEQSHFTPAWSSSSFTNDCSLTLF